MLTHVSKIVLKELKKLTKNTNSEIAYLGETTCFCLFSDYDITYDYSKYQGEIISIISLLEKEGYVEYTCQKQRFRLTQKAIRYNEGQYLFVKSFFFSSILTPILVSFVTTLITLWLQGLLV